MIVVAQAGTKLRAYEEPNLVKYFGEVVKCKAYDNVADTVLQAGADYVYWRPDTERTKLAQLAKMIGDYAKIGTLKHINAPIYFNSAQSKDCAWRIWDQSGIPCPRWFQFTDANTFWAGFEKHTLQFPILLRLNNSVTAHESYLVRDKTDLADTFVKLEGDYQNPRYGGGVCCRMVAQEFIETRDGNGYRSSYRIIVAGRKVVTGYARLTGGEDWVAITNRFTKEMAWRWVEHNQHCESFCKLNMGLIVGAVRALGLNFQGVDVIIGQDGKPYFLEVQPAFSVGYLNAENKGWKPPFYNPSYPELVEFLLGNENRLRVEIPLYYENWLDKNRLFDLSFAALKEFFECESKNT